MVRRLKVIIATICITLAVSLVSWSQIGQAQAATTKTVGNATLTWDSSTSTLTVDNGSTSGCTYVNYVDLQRAISSYKTTAKTVKLKNLKIGGGNDTTTVINDFAIFSGFTAATTISFTNCYFRNKAGSVITVKSWKSLFKNCKSLKKVVLGKNSLPYAETIAYWKKQNNISSLNTSTIQSIVGSYSGGDSMFYGCTQNKIELAIAQPATTTNAAFLLTVNDGYGLYKYDTSAGTKTIIDQSSTFNAQTFRIMASSLSVADSSGAIQNHWVIYKKKPSIKYVTSVGSDSATTTYSYNPAATNTPKAQSSVAGYTAGGWYSDSSYTKKVTTLDGSDYTLYGKYTPITYSITYELNGGTQNSNNPTSYTVETYSYLYSPTKEGYDFVGWYSDAEFTDRVTTIYKGSTGNLKLYAKWDAKKYTYVISYQLKLGDIYIGYNYDLTYSNWGETYERYPEDDTWYIIDSTEGDDYRYTLVNTDEASFQEIKSGTCEVRKFQDMWEQLDDWIKVSLNEWDLLTEWELPENTTVSNYYGNTQKITPAAIPGYVTPESQTITWDSNEKEIVFVYEPITYQIDFQIDGTGANVEGSAPDSLTCSYGKSFTIPEYDSTQFKRDYYEFVGWETSGSSDVYEPGTTYSKNLTTKNNASIVFKASWMAQEYRIDFAGDLGVDSKSFSYGETLRLPSVDATKTGYEFTGWNTSEDGSGQSFDAGGAINTSVLKKIIDQFTSEGTVQVLTLYPVWTAKTYTVYCYRNDGDDYEATEFNIKYGTAYSKLTSITKNTQRTGYTLKGWSTSDTSFKQVKATDIMSTDDDVFLYAYWTPITYTVTYDCNGGAYGKYTSIKKTYKYGQTACEAFSAGTLFKPKRAGYVFSKWVASGTNATLTDSSNIKRSFTAKAKWTKVKANAVTAKKTTLKKITSGSNKGKYSVTVNWGCTSAKGYQIRYATTAAGLKTAKISTTTKKYFKATLGKKAYIYVQVRSYKLDSTGKKIYSAWTTLYDVCPNRVTVTFSGNGGKIGTKKTYKVSAVAGKAIRSAFLKNAIVVTTPKRSGYTFAGWYYKKANGKFAKLTINTKVTKSTTVYAKWTKK